MKKLFAILLGVCLAVGTVFLTACGGDKAFNGNYSKEATAQESAEVFDKVLDTSEGKTIIGDINAENFAIGIKASADLSAKFGDKSASLKFDGLVRAERDVTGGMVYNASANLKLDGKLVEDYGMPKIDAKLYIDKDYAYINGKVGNSELKSKMGLAGAMVLAQGAAADMTDFEIPSTNQILGMLQDLDGEQAIALLKEYGAKIYIDNTSGTKVKIAFGKEVVATILGSALPEGAVAEINVYLAFDKEDVLVGVKVEANVSFKANQTAIEVKGNFKIMITNEKVSLPSDLANY